jgi:hypothetical protein
VPRSLARRDECAVIVASRSIARHWPRTGKTATSEGLVAGRFWRRAQLLRASSHMRSIAWHFDAWLILGTGSSWVQTGHGIDMPITHQSEIKATLVDSF